jgi:hypothetical protein
MSDETVPQAEVDSWMSAIANLYYGGKWDPGDSRAAEHAVAYLWSGYGYLSAPIEVLEMFHHAIEIGYMTALEDVRRGSFDAEIAQWRPDLAEG